jgi:Fe2+ or Zn2+ uptake regulation protein
LLAAEKRPVSMEYLVKKLGSDMDQVTLYRALEAFLERGMIVQFDFGHGHAHYELAHDRPHHHHAVCESCGKIEDIPAQDPLDLMKVTLRKAPGFARLNRHSLEFYGQCVSCAP